MESLELHGLSRLAICSLNLWLLEVALEFVAHIIFVHHCHMSLILTIKWIKCGFFVIKPCGKVICHMYGYSRAKFMTSAFVYFLAKSLILGNGGFGFLDSGYKCGFSL